MFMHGWIGGLLASIPSMLECGFLHTIGRHSAGTEEALFLTFIASGSYGWSQKKCTLDDWKRTERSPGVVGEDPHQTHLRRCFWCFVFFLEPLI